MSLRSRKRSARLELARLVSDVLREEDAAESLQPQGIHHMRVAVRRLRAALRALVAGSAGTKFDKKLKRLQDTLGPIRDAHVQLEWAEAGDPLARQLQQRLREEKRTVADAIDRFRKRDAPKLLLELAKLKAHPLDGKKVRGALRKRQKQLDRRLASAGDLVDERAVHLARVTAKKTRYLAELVADGDGDEAERELELLKTLQTSLGDLHDLDVRRGHLDALLGTATGARRAALLRQLGKLQRERAKAIPPARKAIRAIVRHREQ